MSRYNSIIFCIDVYSITKLIQLESFTFEDYVGDSIFYYGFSDELLGFISRLHLNSELLK